MFLAMKASSVRIVARIMLGRFGDSMEPSGLSTIFSVRSVIVRNNYVQYILTYLYPFLPVHGSLCRLAARDKANKMLKRQQVKKHRFHMKPTKLL
jgi:hypothetical protein